MHRTRLLLVLVASFALLFAACGEDPAPEYSDENREAFLASCTNLDEDDLIQTRLCQCGYEEAESSLDIERFLSIEEEMRDDPEAPLPEEIVELLAQCIIEEADL